MPVWDKVQKAWAAEMREMQWDLDEKEKEGEVLWLN